MPTPSEHKTVQARILEYAQDIGWTFVPRDEAEQRRGFEPDASSTERNRDASLYFDDLLYAKVREFNPLYAEQQGALLNQFRHLHTNIYGNREFVDYLRNRGKFFDQENNRERDLILIDYDNPKHNVFEVTEEWAFHNAHYGTREDVVFLINGIPVLVIECKNADKDEAIALGVDQIRRYHRETPELFVPEQLFTATDAIGFSYGVTWNTARRNIFNWKDEQIGQLEAKVKSFCAIPLVLSYLKDYIIFAEKDEELNKYILSQHQTGAVGAIIERALNPGRTRGLIWHTQGSGKTFTMIKAAELLFRAPAADKPTILLMIDRNELEDQMLKNLEAVGLSNLKHADSIARLNRLLKDDYRGIIVTMIHKFHGMPADLNTRANIYVLIDEAHRTTGGDLGNYLMAGLPEATYIGFTGTPVDKTAYGKGTFKTFGCEDDQGYLHKYSISDSIEDGTTLPLYYQIAPNEMCVPHETLDAEFLSLAEAEGVADIEELNKVLERAVNLKNFLKGNERIKRVAGFVARHYREHVEPLGYKAFLVGVDREACARYKHALDTEFEKLGIPSEYSEVVYTGNNNDSALLKEFHLDKKKERQIRKRFTKLDQQPKILIVTEKLLTGFDAPLLYAMYLDKPMRDHTLLQAIARVNRPYENEAQKMKKPHGFVLDFVGIFEQLEKALAFDSDEINAIVKDIKLLKVLFRNKMEEKVPEYLSLIESGFDDKDVDILIEHFRDPERRKAFFKEYREIEMLYEIISPDIFLRPFIETYGTLTAMFQVVRKAYTKRVQVDREFQRKTQDLVRDHVDTYGVKTLEGLIEINADTIELIKKQNSGDAIKVINLIKAIEKSAEESSDDPYLIAMAKRAQAVQESFENRQSSTAEALEDLIKEVEKNEERKKEQAEKSFDGLTYFVYRSLLDAKIDNAVQERKKEQAEKSFDGLTYFVYRSLLDAKIEVVSRKIRRAFSDFPNWRVSEDALRELRKKVTYSIYEETEDLNQVASLVNDLFTLLEKADRI